MTAIAFKYTTTHKYNVKYVRKVSKRLNIVFVIVRNILITNKCPWYNFNQLLELFKILTNILLSGLNIDVFTFRKFCI